MHSPRWRAGDGAVISRLSMNSALADARLRKLNFRAWRRGFREADLIVGAFADAELPAMSAADLDRFEALLEVADGDLYDWIIDRTPPAPEHDHALMHRLRAFRHSVSAAPSTVQGG